MTLGDLIKSRREALSMTLDEVADASGCSKSYVWEVENHKGYKMSLVLAARLSVALGLQVSLMAAAALESERKAAKQQESGDDR
ncbi:helix-turn-helix transcriptional regulator [Paraburkholderia sp. SARCC-3016]|uniref:helix-turn-helix domain-containing protein n=1 Tax=Paraburkholderia sp. SARCC-3016 TaxID=3058611 RepID=UPI0028073EC2|nr:helix-turn-helix transcriptional regulator [Paraburkholderia sp. SARCC-3016]MDQ7982246.1 helix-turn-helix transcriptional regulator [Paraburkholderia sp. SARCC-3016]